MSEKEQPAATAFVRKPENDFSHYIYAYYGSCRNCFEPIEAIAGKWMFRDLVPGLSDFDTRFIIRDGMKAEDWCRMSTAIGEAHLALCQRHICWARNLEHLPGINLTWSELTSEKTYYPEYQQWSFYHSEHPKKVETAIECLAKRPWDTKDEYFHLKKFCSYYGRYDRLIDPPINLGVHENKYPLHSRLMHYFTPAVQAACCLLERRNIAGKFDALELARRRFPNLGCWGIVNEILHADYEVPQWYQDPLLSELEDELETALRVISVELQGHLTLVPGHLRADVGAWRCALRNVPIEPALVISESARFSRLMKGRLLFYAKAPSHFETSWLIANELSRIGHDLFHVPFKTYWKVRTGESITDTVIVLDTLRGDLLTPTEVAAVREFAQLTSECWQRGQEKEIAASIVDVYDDFFKALTKISEAVYQAETIHAKQ